MYPILAVALTVLRERRISPGLLLIAQLSLPTVGFALLQDENGEVRDGWLVLAAPLIVAVGIALGPHRKPLDGPRSTNKVLPQFLSHALCILTVLATLHFALGGIPVFSSSIETDRFNLGSSGLGGFPSRAVLYGIPATALLALATVTEDTKKQTVSIWVVYATTQLALGFKGALAEIIIMAAIGYLIRIRRPRLKHLALFGIGALFALAYVEIVRSVYATTSSDSTGGLTYILDRSTKQAIESGYLALWHSPDFAGGLSAYWHDMEQLLARYLGHADSGDYTFDMLMSSIVTGTPLGVGMFIVPVTVGGAVYLLFSLTPPLVVGALVAIGAAWSWAVEALRNHSTVFRAIFAAVLIMGLRIFLLNGNGAYLTINLAFSTLLLWMCALPAIYAQRPRSLSPALAEGSVAKSTRPLHG